MSECRNCTGAIISKKSADEKIVDIAKQKAKESGQWVGLFRNEHGELCIATGGETVSQFITPDMQ